MSDREGYLKRRDQLLMQDEKIAKLRAELTAEQENAQGFHDHLTELEAELDTFRGASLLLTGKLEDAQAELAELKKAYNEMISQSQDQILELQAELEDTVTECLAAKSNEDILRKQLAELREAAQALYDSKFKDPKTGNQCVAFCELEKMAALLQEKGE